MRSNTFKRNIVLVFLFFIGLGALQAQMVSNTISPRTLKIEATKVVKELQENIEVSDYQAKSVIQVLSSIAKKRSRIELGNLGSTKKLEELALIDKEKEQNLRSILNDQQYDMLFSLLDTKE